MSTEHRLRKIGCRTGDVSKVLDYQVGPLFPNVAGRQIQVVIVQHHYRGWTGPTGFLDDRLSEGLIYRDVAVFPGIVRRSVNVGRSRRVPHVVLQEPQQGITENAVELVIGVPGGDHEAQNEVFAGRVNLDAPLTGHLPVTLTHGAGDPDNLNEFTYAGQGSNYSPATTAGLKLPIIDKVVFNGPPVTGENKSPVGQSPAAYVFQPVVGA
jgi:hypothetical protein